MRRLYFMLGLAVLLVANTAQAEDVCAGKGFSVRVPAGFEKLSAADMSISPVHGMDLTARIARASAATRSVYTAGSLLEPDALLLVTRIEREGGALGGSRARHRYMLDRIFLSKPQFDGLVADGKVELRPIEIADHEALAMSHPGAEGLLGLEEPATRALLLVADDYILVVVLMVRNQAAYPTDATWAAVRGSLEVAPAAVFFRQALLYGGVGLAGLILLLVLARVVGLGAGRRGPDKSWGAPGGLALSTEGWGGGPAASAAGPASETLPPVAAPSPAPEALGAEPDLDDPLAAPAAPPPLPAAQATAPRAAPPGLRSTKPGAGGPPALPPREPTPAEGPPTRKGLQRTLPPSGRFSQ